MQATITAFNQETRVLTFTCEGFDDAEDNGVFEYSYEPLAELVKIPQQAGISDKMRCCARVIESHECWDTPCGLEEVASRVGWSYEE